MEQNNQPDPIDNEILNFSFTVSQTNYILSLLASIPYEKAAIAIAWYNIQGEPQFKKILERLNEKNES